MEQASARQSSKPSFLRLRRELGHVPRQRHEQLREAWLQESSRPIMCSGRPTCAECRMQNVLIVIQLIVSVGLIGVVLLQRSEGGALGMGGGGSGLGGLFSPRGAADTLTRTTTILAALFFATSLGLTLLALHGRPQSASILDQQTAPNATRPIIPVSPGPAAPKPAIPSIPRPH